MKVEREREKKSSLSHFDLSKKTIHSRDINGLAQRVRLSMNPPEPGRCFDEKQTGYVVEFSKFFVCVWGRSVVFLLRELAGKVPFFLFLFLLTPLLFLSFSLSPLFSFLSLQPPRAQPADRGRRRPEVCRRLQYRRERPGRAAAFARARRCPCCCSCCCRSCRGPRGMRGDYVLSARLGGMVGVIRTNARAHGKQRLIFHLKEAEMDEGRRHAPTLFTYFYYLGKLRNNNNFRQLKKVKSNTKASARLFKERCSDSPRRIRENLGSRFEIEQRLSMFFFSS